MYDRFVRLLRDSLIYGLSRAAQGFIGFVLLPVYTRVFMPNDYGVMDVITTMTALASIVLVSGTETALSYYYFSTDNPNDRRITVTTTAAYLILVNLTVTAGVLAFAGPIVKVIFGNTGSAALLRVAALSIAFVSFTGLNRNVLRLQRKPWTYFVLSISTILATVLLTIYLVVVRQTGIFGVFWANLATAIVFSIVGLVINRDVFTFSFSVSRLRQILTYGLPLIVGGLSVWSINYLNRLFLLRHSTLDEIGLYSVGFRIASVVTLVTLAFRTANAPFQFEISGERDARQIYSRTLRYYLVVTSLISVPLSLFARPILQLLVSEAYINAYQVVALLSFSAIAYGLYQIVGIGLLVSEKTSFVSIAIGIGALMNIGYLLLLVPPLGIVGAALATFLTHISIIILLYIRAQRVYPVPYDLGHAFRVVVSASAVIGVGIVAQPPGFWEGSLVAVGLVAVYVALVFALSLIETHERRVIWLKTRSLWQMALKR